MAAGALNRFSLRATLVERDALRYTPAGLAALNCKVSHVANVIEAEHERTVEFEAQAVALGALAHVLQAAPLGCEADLIGFLAPRTRSGRQLILHITELEFVGRDTNATPSTKA